ncbi:MAG: site-specific integrase [Clostridia bacterium]|nr:site-specific integrase [Clostridia bacterium]
MASYEQNKTSKTWSVRFRTIIDGIEKQKRLSGFRTKKEAQAGYISFVTEQDKKEKEREKKEQEKSLTPSDMLFSDLADKYLAHQKTRIKESSYVTIVSKINKHIIPHFKDMAIKDITPLAVLEWQHSIDHYAYKHKSSLRTQLTSIFKYGERYIGIQNVMARVEPFRNTEPKKDVQCWSYEEFTRFINCCEDPTYHMFFKFLYISGCRKGEALALSWDDIDFNKCTVRINKNLTRKTNGDLYKIVSPKNVSSIRTIDMPQKFLNELKEYKSTFPCSAFVFGGDEPLKESNITRYFKLCAEKVGNRIIRLHDMRHSCASLLISRGISIVAVSHRLGHKNVEQTLNTYSHLMPNEAAQMVRIFDSL